MSRRLPAVNAKQAIRALEKAGFVVDRVVGSHYVMARPGDAALAVTVPYHGSKDLKPGTIRSIVRQTGLTVEEFRRFL